MASNESPPKITPLKKKKVLKFVKKKVKGGLNSSISKKKGGGFNYSLSSSVLKHDQATLRANNRALAYDLEKTKEELRACIEVNTELKRQIQDLTLKNTNLERVVGLKNEEINEEVQRRMKDSLQSLRGILGKIGQQLFDTSHSLGDAIDKCVELMPSSNSRGSSIGHTSRGSSIGHTSRGSSIGSNLRGSSFGSTTLTDDRKSRQNAHRSLCYEAQKESTSEINISEPPTEPVKVTEMSMIAEQSVLLDDISPPDVLMTDHLEGLIEDVIDDQEMMNVESTDKQSKNKIFSGLPQRVPKQKNEKQKEEKGNSEGEENGEKEVKENNGYVTKLSGESSGEDQDISDNKNKNKKQNDNKTSEKNQKLGNVLEDRRNKFIVPELPDEKVSEKVVKSTETKGDNKKDRRGTFVVNTGSSLSSLKEKLEKTVDKDRRGTFVVKKVSVDSSSDNDTSDSVDPIRSENKDRRGTFVLPGKVKTVPTDYLEDQNDCLEDNDDRTQYFNSDMDFTTVLSHNIEIINPVKNVLKDLTTIPDTVEHSEGQRSKTSQIKEKANKEESKKLLKDKEIKKTTSESEIMSGVSKTVELKFPKPGKIVFSASRIRLDEFGKPIPTKIPAKAKSKSKVKIGKVKDSTLSEVTPAKIKSIFDFHDRTPTVTLESQLTASVFDEMKSGEENEKIQENVEKQTKSKGSHKETDSKILPNGPEYRLPMKGSDEENSRNSEKRKLNGRSRSRSRKRNEESEGKMLPDGPTYNLPLKGCSDEDENANMKNVRADERKSRGRSQSRSKKQNEKESTEKMIPDGPIYHLPLKGCSDDENPKNNTVEAKRKTSTRSRSRSKKRQEESPQKQTGSASDDEEKTDSKSSRSRSRSRKSVKAQDYTDDCDEEAIYETKVRRGRSRSRRRLDSESEGVSPEKGNRGRSKSRKESKNVEGMKCRTRSQSRKRADNKTVVGEDETSPVKVSGDSEMEENKSYNTKKSHSIVEETEASETKQDFRKSRSRTRSKVIPVSEMEDNQKTTEEQETQVRKKKLSAENDHCLEMDPKAIQKRISSEDSSKWQKPKNEGKVHERDDDPDQEVLRTKRSHAKVGSSEKEKRIEKISKSRSKSKRFNDDTEDNANVDILTMDSERKEMRGSSGSKMDENIEQNNHTENAESIGEPRPFVNRSRGRSMKTVETPEDLFDDVELHLMAMKQKENSEDQMRIGKTRRTFDNPDVDSLDENLSAKKDSEKTNYEMSDSKSPASQKKNIKLSLEKDYNEIQMKKDKLSLATPEVTSQNGGKETESMENEKPAVKSVKKSTKKRKKLEMDSENEKPDEKTNKENVTGSVKLQDLKRKLDALRVVKSESPSKRSLSDLNTNTSEESDENGRRRRGRATATVSYKEPSLNSKLRRGDAFTNNFFQADFTSPRAKKRKSVPRKHTVLEESINESLLE